MHRSSHDRARIGRCEGCGKFVNYSEPLPKYHGSDVQMGCGPVRPLTADDVLTALNAGAALQSRVDAAPVRWQTKLFPTMLVDLPPNECDAHRYQRVRIVPDSPA